MATIGRERYIFLSQVRLGLFNDLPVAYDNTFDRLHFLNTMSKEDSSQTTTSLLFLVEYKAHTRSKISLLLPRTHPMYLYLGLLFSLIRLC